MITPTVYDGSLRDVAARPASGREPHRGAPTTSPSGDPVGNTAGEGRCVRPDASLRRDGPQDVDPAGPPRRADRGQHSHRGRDDQVDGEGQRGHGEGRDALGHQGAAAAGRTGITALRPAVISAPTTIRTQVRLLL